MSEKNITPETDGKPDSTPAFVVGIGASAGGVEALTQFFEQVSADSGMAYVVILHLSPDYDSQLAQILQGVTSIPVTQVTKTVRIEGNHVYVIPPDKQLQMKDGTIVVRSPARLEERRAPVDIFLRTLAESHGPMAIAVILSGTGANGSMGLKRVKEKGGAVFVQNPLEATFNEMPRHAIATDLVDDILPVAQIPARLLTYRLGLGMVTIPEDAPQRPEDQQQALREVFTQLRLRTGHDFSNYKRSTLLRRLERRISIHSLSSLPAYAAFLREHAEETHALLKDLLISVTNFFRDEQAFRHVEQQVLPALTRPGKETLRIWVAGCATGEEAYSLAMLCAEQTMGVIDAPKVQIFATDIDEDAIATAREGLYTLNDAADVSAERLSRFFSREGEEYRIRREIREMILFAHQNVLKDPPFSKLDLVTCRNLLIYLNPIAQERVMETFHFALNPGGYLLLGLSETVDGSGDLYATISREYHLYQSRQVAARPYPVPESIPPLPQPRKRSPEPAQELENRSTTRLSFGDLHQQVLEQYAPPSIIINEDYDILHVTPLAGRYLHVAGGELSKNLLKLIRPELRLEMRTALYQASQQQSNVEVRNLRIRLEESTETLTLHIRPVLGEGNPAHGFILVLFEQTSDGANDSTPVLTPVEPMARQLEDELVRVKTQLRSANEHHELQAEELKASNEELQAMNEELRSAAEELETSKEELQSINEELTTVNQELKVKVEEASLVSNNLQNLINSTDIATLFLDRSFRVNLFTPATRQIFNLIPSDFGRPLTDITNRLAYAHLQADAEAVLSRLQPIEREVTTTDGRVFIMRILPYRTAEDRISGVVLTFVDITDRKATEEALRESEEKYRTLFEAMGEGFALCGVIRDATGQVVDLSYLALNRALEQQTGLNRRLMIGRKFSDVFPKEDLDRFLPFYARAANSDEPVSFEQYAELIDRWFVVSVYHNKENEISIFYRDITERKRAEERQAYLLELSDTLRPLSDLLQVQDVICRMLGKRLVADRVNYAEIEGEEYIVAREYHVDGLSSMLGRYPIDSFRPDERAAFETGRTVALTDILAEPSLTADEAAAYSALGVRAFVSVPLLKAGRLLAVLSVIRSRPGPWTADEILLVRETAERAWTAVERARAEEALRQSEEKYRTLFNSIDEGFVELDMVTDDKGKVVDYRWLTLNPAFTRLTGLPDVTGRYASEIVPDLDPIWMERFTQLVRTRESMRFEEFATPLGRWFDIFVTPADKVENRVMLVYTNITERKQTEKRQAYLLELSDSLRFLSDPVAIQASATRITMAHFEADRCYYCEIEDDIVTIRQEASRPDLPSVAGTYPLSSMTIFKLVLEAGKPFMVQDIHTTDLLDEPLRQTCIQLQIIALINIPLIKEGRPVGILSMTQRTPRAWTDLDIESAQEAAERIWSAVERARAEEALRETEARLASIRPLTLLGQTEDLAQIGSWEYNQATRQFIWSAGMYRLFGLPPDQPVQPDIYLDFAVEEDRSQAQQVVTYLYEGEGHFESLLRIRVNGQEKTLRIKADVIGEGDQKRVLGVDLDITEQLQAQQQIRETAENLQAVLNSSPASIALLKAVHDEQQPEHILDFRLAVGNDKLAQFLEKPLPELIGQSAVGRFRELLWDGETLDVLRQLYHTRESRYEEKPMPTPNQDRWLALSVMRQDDGIVLTGLDITELKQMQNQHQHWLNELEASRHSVDALAALKASLNQRTELLRAVSHDLRGNFGIISGALQLLGMANTESERAQMMAMVLRNVNQATSLLTDLLDLARLETGQQPRSIVSFDASALLQELGQSLQPAAQERGLSLHLSGPTTLVVENDRQLVYRMAQNIMINALKYTHQGAITVNWAESGDWWWFEIVDTGSGLAPELVKGLNTARPVDPSPSADATATTNWIQLRGEGIGLRIVRELVTLLEAQLQVSSEVGVGTRFRVNFPRRYTQQ